MLTAEVDFLVGIRSKAVEADHYRLSIALQIADMLVEVLHSLAQSVGIGLLYLFHRHAAVHLQALSGSHQHGERRLKTTLAALDIIELLSTQVGTEAGLRDDVIAKGECQTCGQHTVAAMSDVGKRSAMYDSRRVLGGLHQIRMQSILKQHTDGPRNTHILHTEGTPVHRGTQQDIVDAAAQVGLVLSQA